MEKINIIGLGNSEAHRRSFFVFEKKNLFSTFFQDILGKINMIESPVISEMGNMESEENTIYHFINDNYDIDLIFTANRIIVIVRGVQDNLEKFKNLVLEGSNLL